MLSSLYGGRPWAPAGKAGGNGGAATSPAVADNGGKVASVIYINSSDDEDDEQMHWVPSKKRPPGKPGLCSHTASRWQLLAGRGSHQGEWLLIWARRSLGLHFRFYSKAVHR